MSESEKKSQHRRKAEEISKEERMLVDLELRIKKEEFKNKNKKRDVRVEL